MGLQQCAAAGEHLVCDCCLRLWGSWNSSLWHFPTHEGNGRNIITEFFWEYTKSNWAIFLWEQLQVFLRMSMCVICDTRNNTAFCSSQELWTQSAKWKGFVSICHWCISISWWSLLVSPERSLLWKAAEVAGEAVTSLGHLCCPQGAAAWE